MSRLVWLGVILAISCLSYTQYGTADPTRPAEYVSNSSESGKATSEPKLEAIFTTNSGRRAIINGIVFLEAQEKAGIKVVRIQSESVDVEFLQNGVVTSASLSLTNADVVHRTAPEQ